MAKYSGFKNTVLKWIRLNKNGLRSSCLITTKRGDGWRGIRDYMWCITGLCSWKHTLHNYMLPLIRKLEPKYDTYADDTQLYIAFILTEKSESVKAKCNLEIMHYDNQKMKKVGLMI